MSYYYISSFQKQCREKCLWTVDGLSFAVIVVVCGTTCSLFSMQKFG